MEPSRSPAVTLSATNLNLNLSLDTHGNGMRDDLGGSVTAEAFASPESTFGKSSGATRPSAPASQPKDPAFYDDGRAEPGCRGAGGFGFTRARPEGAAGG